MTHEKIITDSTFEDYPLLAYDGPNAGYRASILVKIKDRLDQSLRLTSQCLIVRWVITFPKELKATPDNNCFQDFIEAYRRELKDKLLHYLWVREQHDSDNQHYHLLLFFDGNKIRYFKHKYLPLSLWSKCIKKSYNFDTSAKGLIHTCPGGYNGIPMNHGIMVHRNNEAIKREVYKLCSYLAKVNTKGSAPFHIREYGVSYLKLKQPHK